MKSWRKNKMLSSSNLMFCNEYRHVCYQSHICGIRLSLLYEEKWRVQTFTRYPKNLPTSAILLANEGFVYSGTGKYLDDTVICIFCSARKNNWQAWDDVSLVHAQISPGCSMVTRVGCPNIPLVASNPECFAQQDNLLQRPHELSTHAVANPSTRPNMLSSSTSTHSLSSVQSKRNVPDTLPGFSGKADEKPKNVLMANKLQRLTTFHSFPTYHPVKPVHLALAGFYYTGEGDNVWCFKCGYGAHNWKPEDNPWVEHVKVNSRCAFVQEQMGSLFTDVVQKLEIQRQGNNILSMSDVIKETVKDLKNKIKNGNVCHYHQNADVRFRPCNKSCTFLNNVPQNPANFKHRLKALRNLQGDNCLKICIAVAGYSYEEGGFVCHFCGDRKQEFDSCHATVVEHARSSPFCCYLRRLMGDSFIFIIQLTGCQEMWVNICGLWQELSHYRMSLMTI